MERRTLPGPDYYDPAILELEKENIFFKSWMLVGLSQQIPNPGDWFTFNIFDESILISRGDDEQIRAFYNVCTHRGSRLREEASGSEKHVFACPYHAWCFSLEGELVGTPRVAKEELDRSKWGLRPVHLEVWQGMIWINMDRETPMSLHDWMLDNNDTMLEFERFNIDELHRTRISEWVVESNWKIVIENYSECLHCPTVHPELVKAVPIYKTGWVFEPGREDGGVNAVVGVEGPAGMGDVMLMPAMTGVEAESVFGGSLFPNMFMDITGTNIIISQVVPLTSTTTRVQSWYMFHPDQLNSPGFDPTDIYAFNDLVTEQDNSVCVRAQHGATSRAYLEGGVYPEKDQFVLDFNQNYLRHRDGK